MTTFRFAVNVTPKPGILIEAYAVEVLGGASSARSAEAVR